MGIRIQNGVASTTGNATATEQLYVQLKNDDGKISRGDQAALYQSARQEGADRLDLPISRIVVDGFVANDAGLHYHFIDRLLDPRARPARNDAQAPAAGQSAGGTPPPATRAAMPPIPFASIQTPSGYDKHEIVAGENLTTIARAALTSIKEPVNDQTLAAMLQELIAINTEPFFENDFKPVYPSLTQNPNDLWAGDGVLVPMALLPPPASRATLPPLPAGQVHAPKGYTAHLIAPQETLSGIARTWLAKNGRASSDRAIAETMDRIVAANTTAFAENGNRAVYPSLGGNRNDIAAGDLLLLPDLPALPNTVATLPPIPAAQVHAPKGYSVHTIVANETLSGIARRLVVKSGFSSSDLAIAQAMEKIITANTTAFAENGNRAVYPSLAVDRNLIRAGDALLLPALV